MDEPFRVLYVAPESAPETLVARSLGVARDRVVVETASSVREGLVRLEAATFDCLVGHVDLPGVEGMSFLETVREDHETLPVVLVTGEDSEAIVSDPVGPVISRYADRREGSDRRRVVPTGHGDADRVRAEPLEGPTNGGSRLSLRTFLTASSPSTPTA